MKNLDQEAFEICMGMFRTFKNNLEKKKIEKQMYYANKK